MYEQDKWSGSSRPLRFYRMENFWRVRATSKYLATVRLERVKPNTRKSYASSVKAFHGWCTDNQVRLEQVREYDVGEFLADRTMVVSAGTIKNDWAAIKFDLRNRGIPVQRSEIINEVLAGAQRICPGDETQAHPFTLAEVKRLVRSCDTSELREAEFALACALLWDICGRAGAIFGGSRKRKMQFRDLTPHGVDKYRVNIPTPKARTKDVAAIRSRRSDGLDVPNLLQQVYTIHKKAGTFRNDMPIVSMSYIDMQSELKKRCKKLDIKARNGRRIGTHGFRRGRATHLHALGVRVSDIMLLGRWRSTACLRYLDEDADIAGARHAILSSDY
ncbi:MAG: hypothetical protein MHM6MM_008972 [Cercozoa sp. M6MM]